MKVGIVGATGAVGRQMLTCLEERIPNAEVVLFASERSVGKELPFLNKMLTIQAINENSFEGIDYLLGATENEITKTWVPYAKKANAVVIDNSSAFRLDQDVPLVIPEINGQDAFKHHGLIANPNCATIIALIACQPIEELFKIKRMIVSTYQAVSGAGIGGIRDLENQIQNPTMPSTTFPHPIAYNLIPEIGSIDEFGISKEEYKLQNEGRKILHRDDLLVNCTCVRVPIMRSHSESITLECEKEIDLDLLKEKFKTAKGVRYIDNPAEHQYPMPLNTTNQDWVEVGRVRKDPSDPSNHSLSLFCCGDQIRKGAATNAVEILELLINN